MTNKEIYQQLSEKYDLPLFMQYWWLEGVSAGKDWDVLLLFDEQTEQAAAAIENAEPLVPANESSLSVNEPTLPAAACDKVIAAMPYETEKHLWMKRINQPVLCPYAGVWIRQDILQASDSEERVKAIYKSLDEKMKLEVKPISFNQLFCYNSPAMGYLKELGYKFVTRRTYILSDLSDLQKVIDGFSNSKRKKLEKNTLTYSVEDVDLEEFYRFHQLTQLQKKAKLAYTRETLLVMAEKAANKGVIRVIGVRNADKELLAAAVLVWDNQYAYQLLNTFDHDFPDSGARELLTLEVIKHARSLGLKLDFVFHKDYLKHYGAKKTAYYSVHKGNAIYVMLQRLIDWVKH